MNKEFERNVYLSPRIEVLEMLVDQTLLQGSVPGSDGIFLDFDDTEF